MSRWVPFGCVVDLRVTMAVVAAVLCGCATIDETSKAPGDPELMGWSRPNVSVSLAQDADLRELTRPADSASGATQAYADAISARRSHANNDADGSAARLGRMGDGDDAGSGLGSRHAHGGLDLVEDSDSITGIGLSNPGGVGASGAQGLVLPVNGWSLYREYTFVRDGNAIGPADLHKAREISELVDQHPSYRIGIDGTHQERVNVVRRALIAAGVPADAIEMGEFGDPQLRRDRWVAVLIRI